MYGFHGQLPLTLSFSPKINAVVYPQKVSLPLKKNSRDMSLEGCAAHAVRYKQLSAD
jgi:hypothetical protein